MIQAITATYAQDDDDWTITVSGGDKHLSARAPGIIAARDRVDQLVEQLVQEDEATNGKVPTVVHLLDGSALAFTTAYMTARLTRPREPEQPVVSGDPGTAPEGAESPDATQPADSAEATNAATDTTATPPAKDAPARRPLPRKELSRSPEAVAETSASATAGEPDRVNGLQAALGAASTAG